MSSNLLSFTHKVLDRRLEELTKMEENTNETKIEYPEIESTNELPDLPDVEDEVCEFCGGTGEVTTMEQVYPGEPHYAPIGTQRCICQIEEHDGDGEDD